MIKFIKDGMELSKIDFGETEVGGSNMISIGVKNEYSHTIKLSDAISSDPEVKIIDLPNIINPSETKEMVITFEPSIFRRTPLELSNISFKVVMI